MHLHRHQQQQQQQQQQQHALPDSVISPLEPGTILNDTVFVCDRRYCRWFGERPEDDSEVDVWIVITIIVVVLVLFVVVSCIGFYCFCRGDRR